MSAEMAPVLLGSRCPAFCVLGSRISVLLDLFLVANALPAVWKVVSSRFAPMCGTVTEVTTEQGLLKCRRARSDGSDIPPSVCSQSQSQTAFLHRERIRHNARETP